MVLRNHLIQQQISPRMKLIQCMVLDNSKIIMIDSHYKVLRIYFKNFNKFFQCEEKFLTQKKKITLTLFLLCIYFIIFWLIFFLSLTITKWQRYGPSCKERFSLLCTLQVSPLRLVMDVLIISDISYTYLQKMSFIVEMQLFRSRLYFSKHNFIDSLSKAALI